MKGRDSEKQFSPSHISLLLWSLSNRQKEALPRFTEPLTVNGGHTPWVAYGWTNSEKEAPTEPLTTWWTDSDDSS